MEKIGLIIWGVTTALTFIVALIVLMKFRSKLKAAKTVRKIDEGLYTMEFVGDYGFDEFLARGGASTDRKMAEYITEVLSNGFCKPKREEVKKDFGCSTIVVTDNNGRMLFGRNYDWQKCTAMIMHTKPKKGYESYSTCCLEHLGFGEGWKPEGMGRQYTALAGIYVPTDGINEKGLCVADLVCLDGEAVHQENGRTALTIGSAIRMLLDKAATVDEAVDMLKNCDMNSSIGMAHHLAITDTTGKAVVVEYAGNEMLVTGTPIVTNHSVYTGNTSSVDNQESHTRFGRLMEIHENIEGSADKEKLRNCMSDVSYEDITQWSIVYDVQEKAFDFYWQREYGKAYSFKLNL